MSLTKNICVNTFSIYSNGAIKSHKLTLDPTSNHVLSSEDLSHTDIDVSSICTLNESHKPSYLVPNFNLSRITDRKVNKINLSTVEDINCNFTTEISTNSNDHEEFYVYQEVDTINHRKIKFPNTNKTVCQNCEKTFTTKYQYQRHQCEFNADKIILKPEVLDKDIDKITRLKFECDVCGKAFISNNNLERHRNSHNSTKNVCEDCSKTFVSENRLKIHQENHCKNSGKTKKFYRCDVAVWRCEKCKQVFSTEASGALHTDKCSEMLDDPNPTTNKNLVPKITVLSEEDKSDINVYQIKSELTHNDLQKVKTEMLYQCEFCNRTYAASSSVLKHQVSHRTDKNYQCVFCFEHFDNYTQAVTHWQNVCYNESNLFYLPKLVYCEYCDRGFKSHEILYNHKNKKKHFTPKKIKSQTSLIENVFDNIKNDPDNVTETESNDPVVIESNSHEIVVEQGKKKRGRKRKFEKTEIKNKNSVLKDGYQYQCERCPMIFDDIPAMDVHKDKEHASIFSCQQCGQV